MSVDYRAVVACGWVVSDAEVRQLDDDIREDLMDYETLIQLVCFPIVIFSILFLLTSFLFRGALLAFLLEWF